VLARGLGTFDAAAVVVSNVIGSGILFLPAIVALIAPTPWALIGVWLIGGLLAFAGAMAYAELSAMRPKAGGEYIYLREAFGPVLAFMTGWTSFVAGFSGAIATSALGLAGFLGRFLPFAGDASTALLTLPLGVATLSLTPQSLVAIAVIAALSLVHILGLGPGRLVQNSLAIMKVVGLLAFVLAGLAWGRGSVEHFSLEGDVPATALLLALVPVMFTYSGWNAAAYVAEEIRDPARNVPRALALGTLAVIVVYLGLIVVFLYAASIADLQQIAMQGGSSALVLAASADRLFGAAAGDAVTVIAVMIMAGSISAMVFAGPRVYYAMARDGLFFEAAGRVHRRWQTPAVSIAAQAVWSALLVLSGGLRALASYTGFAVVLFSGIAVAALFVLRLRAPEEPRPFRAWGYPVAPGIFALFSLVMVLNAIWREPTTSAAGLVIIGLGLPLYFVVKRRG
jgi:APA family basic amino acid/polyamine antiporter